MANASTGYVGVAVETTGGVALPPTKYLPVTDVDFPSENTFIDVKEIRGSRQATQSYDGAVKPTASIKSGFYGSGAMGTFMLGLFGGVATTNVTGSTTSKLHTFSDASLPYLTLERADTKSGVAGGLIVERLGGCKVESMQFACTFGQDVKVTTNFQALRFPDATVSKAVAPVFPTQNPFIFKGASVFVDGVLSSQFKDVTFDFKNTLERQDALNGTRESAFIFEGGFDCTLSGKMIFSDLVMYNKFNQGTNMAIKVQFVGDSLDVAGTPPTFYTATFVWTNVKLSKFGIPFTAGGIINADCTFKIKFDGALGRSVQATLQNADVTGTYAT